jgi:hypothetical protein
VPGPGRGKKLPRQQKVQSGNRRVYLVNRIARDRPDMLARMKAGEFETVRQAARAAGILPAHGGERQGRQLRRPVETVAPCLGRSNHDNRARQVMEGKSEHVERLPCTQTSVNCSPSICPI